jgi:hypothetical protein
MSRRTHEYFMLLLSNMYNKRPMIPLRADGHPVSRLLFSQLVPASMSILEMALAIEIQRHSLSGLYIQSAGTIVREHHEA